MKNDAAEKLRGASDDLTTQLYSFADRLKKGGSLGAELTVNEPAGLGAAKEQIAAGRRMYDAGEMCGEWTPGELLVKVGALDTCRLALPYRQKRALISMIVAILATFALRFIGWLLPFGDLLFLAGVVVTIVLFVIWRRLKKRMYDGDAPAFLGPFVRCLTGDLAEGSRIKVRAGLTPYNTPSGLLKTGAAYSRGNFPNCVDSFFRRDLLKLECSLRDGTRLMVEIVEQIRETTMVRKRRKKTKQKVDRRTNAAVKMRLLLDGGRCRLTGQMKLPVGVVARVRQHPRGALVSLLQRQKMKGDDTLDAGTPLSAMAGVYAAISLVRNEQNQGGIQ